MTDAQARLLEAELKKSRPNSRVRVVNRYTAPFADDVATLALDMLVREGGYRRGSVNPFLLGY